MKAFIGCMIMIAWVVQAFAGQVPTKQGAKKPAASTSTAGKDFSFPLIGKTVTMGTDDKAIQQLFPDSKPVEKTEQLKAYSQVLQLALTDLQSAAFKFRDNKLVTVDLNSNETGGLEGKPLQDFKEWTKKLGKGNSNTVDSVVTTTWKVAGGVTVQREEWFSAESGDSGASFVVTTEASKK
jgi:hypothetical protein